MIDANLLLSAYISAYFPMAEPDEGKIYWYSPDPRAVFLLEKMKMPRSIRKLITNGYFDIKINSAFESVVRNCSKRDDSWISEEIILSYINLHHLGFAHSVEAYHNNELAGGLYGVSIGGAFFGESMFFNVSNASKAAFYSLVEIMKKRGFILLDTQFLCDHTLNLGAVEIPKEEYLSLLDKAVSMELNFA
jgi:leucyl/phenylalanyl-tRNA---protein transferase